MANIKLNTKHTTRLSLKSIEEYQEFLKKYRKQLLEVAENIVKRVSEVGLEGNYNSTELLPIKTHINSVSGGIKTTDEKDTYREFGTGIVGSNNPHVAEYLAKVGWKYDVNEHGEKGWIYPKPDGTFGWTKGIPAEKKFYEAVKNMEDRFQEIATEEFKRING